MKSLLDEYLDTRVKYYRDCIDKLFSENNVNSNVDLINININAHKKYIHFCNIITELSKIKGLLRTI